MATEWMPGRLGDIAELIMGQSPAGETCNERGEGVPLLNGPTEFGGHYPQPTQFTTDPRKFAEPDDLLFCVRGSTTGRMNWANQRYAIGRGLAAIRPKHGRDFRHFVRAVIEANLPHLLASATGSTFPNVSRDQIQTIECNLPPLPEQKAIARILGTLDDKIENNRKLNHHLEQMARALFKSWFVDFDPVHTNKDKVGRKKDEISALFPASFQGSELGPIPSGWQVGSIYEISDVIYGAPFASRQFNSNGEGMPLIRIRDLADENPCAWTPEVHPKGYTVQPGDIVVGMDGEFRAYLWGGVPAWLNQRVCVFAPKPGCSAAFVRNSIIAPLADVEATETATTVIHLGKSDIDRFKVVVPPPEIHVAFAKLCQPWYDQIVANKQQSRTLATLRNTLLPKLLNGELSVADAAGK